jgi:predicted MFS family arabinose efflux permease
MSRPTVARSASVAAGEGCQHPRQSSAPIPQPDTPHSGTPQLGTQQPTTPPPAPGAHRVPTHTTQGFGLKGQPDYWRLWSVGLIIFIVRWLETVAIAVFVYRHTASPLMVALTTMLRLLPMGLLGAFLGAWAERIERRATMIGVVVLMLATSLTLALLAWTNHLQVWHLAVASFLNGVGWATDNPVRRALIGEVVGASHMATAMSLDVGANNASRMVGPTVGGLLLASIGLAGVFSLSVTLYAAALVAVIGIRHRDHPSASSTSMLTQIAEGIAVVRADRRLIATLVVTIIYNVFAWPFTSMVPVIGQDSLQLGPEGIGILASMDGIGAFIGAIVLTLFLRPAWYVHAYLGGIASYLIMLIIFAFIPHPLIAGAALLLTGLGGAGFSTMQATLVYLSSPPEMRSRILGVLSVCIGTGPIGFVGLGLLANAIGASAATIVTGSVGLLALLATWPLWRAPAKNAALITSP